MSTTVNIRDENEPIKESVKEVTKESVNNAVVAVEKVRRKPLATITVAANSYKQDILKEKLVEKAGLKKKVSSQPEKVSEKEVKKEVEKTVNVAVPPSKSENKENALEVIKVDPQPTQLQPPKTRPESKVDTQKDIVLENEDIKGDKKIEVIDLEKSDAKVEVPVAPADKNVEMEESKETIDLDETVEDKENIDLNSTSDLEDSPDMSIDGFKDNEEDWCFSQMLLGTLSDYDEEIQKYLLRFQTKYCADPGYLARHEDEINSKMRIILIDWMVEVVEEYKMTSETLFLAVNFIDRFLSILGVIRSKFQLLGTTALFISSKYEEIYPPDISDFVYVTDNAYDKLDILDMEAKILKALDFNVSNPTIHFFLRKHLSSLGLKLGLPQKVGILAEYLCYLALLECDPCITYLPNDIAVSAIVLSSSIHGIELNLSGETGQAFFPGFSPKQLKAHLPKVQSCMDTLDHLRKASKIENDTLRQSGKSQQAIFNKYAQEKYFCVSLMDIGDQEAPKLTL